MSGILNHTDLDSPTVGDMVKFLSVLDPNMPFRIEDPDTSWTISLIKVYQEDGAVWLTGDYSSMNIREDR